MSEWKDSYNSAEDNIKSMADIEKERHEMLKADRTTEEGLRREQKMNHEEQVRLQKLNMGICIYRDFGRDQDKWPAWIRARAGELGIE